MIKADGDALELLPNPPAAAVCCPVESMRSSNRKVLEDAR